MCVFPNRSLKRDQPDANRFIQNLPLPLDALYTNILGHELGKNVFWSYPQNKNVTDDIEKEIDHLRFREGET